ncbi:globin [Sphingomonas sp. Leaf339]|uniref:group I truncated hemoglobin n=1 Tax=Sphingomonas sp. Leaf339 TaxID=1736343 RepID=UPI0006F60371|nr:group 1 truncated hemoglobin [Sphingomonas sp. Leaf339]KQU49697.1 globin [Sphingomonas sp. Leaf339]
MSFVPIILLMMSQAATPPGEQPVAPYPHHNANAGATPFADDRMWQAFHESAGVGRIVDDLVATNIADPRISDIFKGQDMIRLRRTLKEQFCYLLNGGCDYSGRTMAAAHADMGIQDADMAALVENLQAAMRREHVSFAAQNRLLAKLAPMRRTIVKQRDLDRR